MDGLIEQTATAPERARNGRGVGAQHYDTAMRKVRLSMQGLAWTQLLTAQTRHYKTGKGLRAPALPAVAAWLHALDASPWLLPAFDCEAAIVAAYMGGPDEVMADLSLGAACLSELPALRVVRIETVGQLQAWVQRIGPAVLGGGWSSDMDIVARDTEAVGPRVGTPRPHAVGVVGIKPDHVRIVNNQGPAWGALGRAWMHVETVDALLRDGGEAWGVVPVDLTPKRGAK